MSVVMITLIAAAACGGLMVLYAASRSKHMGGAMLSRYEELLAEARDARRKQLGESLIGETTGTEPDDDPGPDTTVKR